MSQATGEPKCPVPCRDSNSATGGFGGPFVSPFVYIFVNSRLFCVSSCYLQCKTILEVCSTDIYLEKLTQI